MFYDFGFLAATLPDALSDQTTYKFVDGRDSNCFSVTYEDVPPASTTQSLVAQKMQTVSAVYGGSVHLHTPLDFSTVLGGGTEAVGSVALPDEERFEISFAYLKVSDSRAAVLSTVTTDAFMQATYDSIFRSATLVRSEPHATAPGLSRRFTGRLSFALPESFQPPRSVRLAFSTLVLEASLESTRPPSAPRIEDVAYIDEGTITMEGGGTHRPVHVQKREGLLETWVFVHRLASGTVKDRYGVTRLTLPTSEGDRLSLWSRASERDWGKVGPLWTSLFSTLEVEGAES